MYTHVIFDLDGTILNTIDDLADAGNHICAARGWPTHPVEKFKRMVGNGIPALVRRFSPQGLSEEELDGVREEFAAYYALHKEDKTAPYAGMPEVLSLLKAAGVKVSVLTNKADALAGPIVEGYYPGVFDAVRGALPGVPAKPHPDMLKGLMELIGAEAGTSLFVGDSDVDILTGQNGGLDTCGVLWGFRDREELEGAGADHIAERPEELLSIITGTALFIPGEGAGAAALLAAGGLVALPTETVYGLAADAFNEGAVHANYEAKGRPETKPLNVLVDGMKMVEGVCRDLPAEAYHLAEKFWPGPLTMILQGRGTLPDIVPAGGKTQGVRCPDHRETLEVIRALGRPLACPSANLSGQPSPGSAAEVLAQLAGRIDGVLDGGPCSVGVESTILDLTANPFRILRQGGLSRESIEKALGRPVEGADGSGPMTIIGITGPTGAGKTTALDAIRALGAEVIDCDRVYHELLAKCQPMLDDLRGRYGAGIFDENGALQRKALGAIVFEDEQALDDLNAITHRYVSEAVDRRLEQARAEGKPAVAVDAIALLESDLAGRCHCTVAVVAPDEVRVRRIMARDGISEEYARLRIEAQKPADWFSEHCDHTLHNGGNDREGFFREAKALFEDLIF